jgi:hypothetical protein
MGLKPERLGWRLNAQARARGEFVFDAGRPDAKAKFNKGR